MSGHHSPSAPLGDLSAQAPAERRRPSALQRAFVRTFMRACTVRTVATPGPSFRLIGLEGEALRNLRWSAGDRVQINQGGLFSARSYTPIRWEMDAGRTDLLIHAAGQGPGAEWAANVCAGDPCQILGPTRVLDLGGVTNRIGFFGDETSIATSIALQGEGRPAAATLIECQDVGATKAILSEYGVLNAVCIPARSDSAHLDDVARTLKELDVDRFALTGSATSIQHLHRMLRGSAASRPLICKPYWAPGKTCLS